MKNLNSKCGNAELLSQDSDILALTRPQRSWNDWRQHKCVDSTRMLESLTICFGGFALISRYATWGTFGFPRQPKWLRAGNLRCADARGFILETNNLVELESVRSSSTRDIYTYIFSRIYFHVHSRAYILSTFRGLVFLCVGMKEEHTVNSDTTGKLSR